MFTIQQILHAVAVTPRGIIYFRSGLEDPLVIRTFRKMNRASILRGKTHNCKTKVIRNDQKFLRKYKIFNRRITRGDWNLLKKHKV